MTDSGGVFILTSIWNFNISNSTFFNNDALNSEGGVLCLISNNSDLLFISNIFSNNSASSGSGGVLYA